MLSEAGRLYISRKRGKGMGKRYLVTSMLPLVVLLAVSAALSFALVFISSVSSQIDRMIAVMGSGTLYALSDPSAFVPPEAEVSAVRNGSALIYAEGGTAALEIKGIEEGYFSGMRSDELEMIWHEGEAVNPVVISSSSSASLSLSPGDRFTMLVWEENEGRARPFLCTVGGVFSSVYPQLDSHLAFVPASLLSSEAGYEILLPAGDDPDSLLALLWDNGIPCETYRTMYSSLYSNVLSSVGILYVILLAVALLAAFFSSDAAHFYIDRDRKDIKELLILGMERKQVRSLYFRIALSFVTAACICGCIIGTALAFLSPLLLRFISRTDPALLEYYVTSFSIDVPFMSLSLMVLLSLLVSSLSVYVSMRRSRAFF